MARRKTLRRKPAGTTNYEFYLSTPQAAARFISDHVPCIACDAPCGFTGNDAGTCAERIEAMLCSRIDPAEPTVFELNFARPQAAARYLQGLVSCASCPATEDFERCEHCFETLLEWMEAA